MEYKLGDVVISTVGTLSTDEALFLDISIPTHKDKMLFIYLTGIKQFRTWFNLVEGQYIKDMDEYMYIYLPYLSYNNAGYIGITRNLANKTYLQLHKNLAKEVNTPKYREIYKVYAKDTRAFEDLMEIIRVEATLLE